MSGKIFGLILLATFAAKGFAFDLENQKAVDLNEVQTALRAYGNPWQAGDSWVSRLSKAEIKRMLGANNVPNPDLQFRAKDQRQFRSRGLSFDWRNMNGVNWVSPILNQGNCGSCVAFATVGTLETQMNISSKIPNLNPRLSTQALFACGGGRCEKGWRPDDAEKYLSSHGVPDAACLPYTSGATGEDVRCSAACSDIVARSVKTAPSKSRDWAFGSQFLIKQALQKGPVETTLAVYADFISYKSGVYKHVTGEQLGGHAVSIVGFDDTAKAWIIRNSWGTEWGEKGFVRISYDDTSGIGMQIWGFQLPKSEGYVVFETPADRQILTGTANLTISSTVDSLSKFKYTILDAFGHIVQSDTRPEIPESINLDTTTLQDGQYEIFADATTSASNSIKSLHTKFYVLNSKPTGTLSFKPKGFDITKPLKDRVVFDISAQSNPVPYSTLRLHLQQNGKDAFTNFIDTVLPAMTMGWRTNMGPNGTYDLFLTADIIVNGETIFRAESTHTKVTVAN